jgi:hypothetical protein
LLDYGSTLGSLPLPQSENCAYWFGQIYGEPIIQGCYIADQEIGDPDKSGGTTAGEKYVNRDLISPVIDISNFGSATLSFWTWWEIEGRNPGSGYDRMEVYVSKGPTYYPWTRVALLNPVEDPDHTISALHPDWPYSSGGYNQPARWIQHKLNLNSFLGNQIKIKFAFNSWDSQFNGFRGWLIDNLGVYPEALSASQISSSSVDLRPDHGEVTPTLR